MSRFEPMLLPALFAALGGVWIAGAAGMPLWTGFAPDAGFLPLIYGVLLVALSLAVLAAELRQPAAAPDAEPVGKPLLVLGAVAACVVGVEVAGFGPAIFLLLAFLFGVVERQPPLLAVPVAAAVAAAILLVFSVWLGVPLPVGPLGF